MWRLYVELAAVALISLFILSVLLAGVAYGFTKAINTPRDWGNNVWQNHMD